jgi:hypothetical protein
MSLIAGEPGASGKRDSSLAFVIESPVPVIVVDFAERAPVGN